MVSEQTHDRRDTVLGTTPQKGGATQGDVGAQVQDVAGQAQEKAGQLVDQAKEQATGKLATQKDRAVDSLGTVAEALREAGKHLRENEQQSFAQYADKAAERVEQFSGNLRGKDVQTIVRDLEGYARRQPAVFLGGAFVLGLVAARFLKSTAQREDEGDNPSGYQPRYRPGGRSGYYSGNQPGYYSGAYTEPERPGYGGAYGTAYGTDERSWYVRGRGMQ